LFIEFSHGTHLYNNDNNAKTLVASGDLIDFSLFCRVLQGVLALVQMADSLQQEVLTCPSNSLRCAQMHNERAKIHITSIRYEQQLLHNLIQPYLAENISMEF
jgi:hypothetical protein